MGRARKLAGVVGAVAALAGTVIGIGIGAEPAGAVSMVVSNEAAYRSALSVLSSDTSGPHTIDLAGDITVTGGTDPLYSGTQPLTIDGNGFALDGGGTRRVLESTTTSVLTLTDLTVRNGFSTTSGGAVRASGPVTLTSTTFDGNIASGTGVVTGGAVRANGQVTITDSVFTENLAISTTDVAQAGAVSANGGGSGITADRTRFSDNQAGGITIASGGAVRGIDAVTLTDVVLDGNTVTAGGGSADGAAAAAGSVVTVRRGTVVGNTASATTSAVGALSSSGSSVVIEDSTVQSNTAAGVDVYGAAGFALSGITATNALVTQNTATGTGTEVGGLSASGTLTLEHATVIANEGSTAANLQAATLAGVGGLVGDPLVGPNCSVSTTTLSRTVADDASCNLPGGAGNAEAVDLGLGPLRDNGDVITDPATPGAPELWSPFPVAGSPAVDRVPAGQCASDHDLRGVARPFGSACDAGAVEQAYPVHALSDVPPWVEDAVRWLTSDVHPEPLAQGFQNGTFLPNAPITRGQVVRLLHRLELTPGGYPAHGFSDVPAWVEPAVRWAAAEGIVDGFDDGTFRPNDPITRAQVVRMVYRVAGEPSVDGIDPHGFSDVPPWVETAVRWAANPDLPLPLAAGFAGGVFLPNDDITRAQVGRMVYRLALTPPAWEDPDLAPGTVPFRVPL